ncbi:protein F37C4.5-like [Physella acuta]|uniref:protein F37C4.5-like n=1 Tax=Physella acuta TaxID=109671 RepID=UPI0027DB2CDA|nr:protein F37C4.5-like [Physella acuta]
MTEKEKVLNEQLKALKEQKQDLDFETQKNAIKKQWSLLDQFAATAAKNGKGDTKEEKPAFQLDAAYFKGMKEFMQQYKEIGKQLEEERLSLEKKNQELDKKIETVEKNLSEVRGNWNSGHESRECVIVLEAEKETKVSLTVSYVVLAASWSPSYDLRMFTDEGNLKIFYYGLIRQWSGEDWTNVKLFLSTAEPSVGGSIPLLPMTQLAVRKIRVTAAKKGGGFGFAMAKRSMVSQEDHGQNLRESNFCYDAPPAPPPMAMAMAAPIQMADIQVTESTTSTTYEIARQSTIPSDNTEHKVTVAIIDLKPTLSYLTIPKVVPHAYLQAKVTNSSPYTLLAGRTNIFLDNSFVAKAEINAVSPKEEFECSLGVDPGVRVDYKPLIKVNSSSGIISKTQIITYEQAIEIKNVHDYAVKVLVRDNLPRSLDEKIKVNLLVPAIDLKHPEKSEKVKLTKNNHIEWEVELKGTEKSELVLKYSVEHPANEDLETTTTMAN